MATRKRDIGKKPHPAEQMKFVTTPDGDFAAECPICEGYALLTQEEAATGSARCFGELVLVGSGQHEEGGFIK